jgi:hypothetical protein
MHTRLEIPLTTHRYGMFGLEIDSFCGRNNGSIAVEWSSARQPQLSPWLQP